MIGECAGRPSRGLPPACQYSSAPTSKPNPVDFLGFRCEHPAGNLPSSQGRFPPFANFSQASSASMRSRIIKAGFSCALFQSGSPIARCRGGVNDDVKPALRQIGAARRSTTCVILANQHWVSGRGYHGQVRFLAAVFRWPGSFSPNDC